MKLSPRSPIFYLNIFFVLLPVVFFPLSGDLSVFWQGAKCILDGGTIYKDWIDIKPPLIYYLLAGVRFIFGSSEMSVRLFDFLYQFIAAIFLARVAERILKTEWIGAMSGIFYSITYVTQSYSNTAQVETMIALPMVGVMYFHLYGGKKFINYALLGLLVGIIVGFKFTFLPFIIAFPIDDILAKRLNSKELLKKYLIIILGFLLGLFLSFLPFLDSEIRSNFALVLEFLTGYASFDVFSAGYFSFFYKQNSAHWGDLYSLAFTYFVIIGLLNSFKKSFKNEIFFVFLLAVGMFLSVALEKRYLPYHFQRMHIPLALIGAFGFSCLFNYLKENWSKKLYNRVINYLIILLLLVVSPIVRVIGIWQFPVAYLIDRNKYNNLKYDPESTSNLRPEYLDIAEYLNDSINEKSFVMMVNTGGCLTHHYLATDQITGFAQPYFHFNDLDIQEWRAKFEEEIRSADWLVIQTNDVWMIKNGKWYTSQEMISSIPELQSYISDKFIFEKEIGNFRILKRNE